MSFERIMGLEVINDDEYQKYRENMIPILQLFGGSFGFDFKVSEVLKSKTDDAINRVFTLDFPSKESMEEFFTNPDYLVVKDKYFMHSVKSVTTISMHEKNT
ncbi:DUF1330 domain-containing protein [Colwellia sp. Bg11-12]|jgi:uncharacterized protein (DUF1330 family)|uniref:DUF1330 domain-containing protein n=1 Tax=Colwellia sp. Bg11-12 TaxID=2759817 RepID=UPI0015F61E50|nr:DUF1330 domain-containing protein [Colwellia sp. Bg11-12]MBA6262219.1 DUF1330 domain-containing protein [Colwellia sp. Bg11-12]